MSIKAITIYTPADSTPHITAEDDAFIYDSLLRGRSGILGSLTCTKVDNNTVRLAGGGVSNKGFVMYVPAGDYFDVAIANGSQGLMRHDIIAAQFTKGGDNVADAHTFTVIQGIAAVSPSDPSMTVSELSSAGAINQIALFRVVLNGLSIQSITQIGVDAAEIGAVSSAATASSCSGNAASASKLAAARTIALSGDVSGSASFNGAANSTISATVNKIKGKNIFIQSSTPSGAASGDLWFW